jgi:hypothetical protein
LRKQRQKPVSQTSDGLEQNLTTQRQQTVASSSDKLGQTLGKLLVWGVVIVGGLLAAEHWFTPEKQRLAQEYNIPQDRVFILAKPHGCDFDDAPLGNKHCYFEKQVNTVKECPAPDCRVTAVYVTWRKVEE